MTASEFLDAVDKTTSKATGDLYFQPWGGQNQNGDYAESILIEGGTGDSLAYGLPDSDGDLFATAKPRMEAMSAALREVLELHEPFEWSFGYGPVKSCKECVRLGATQEQSLYPCPTVRAIESALNEATKEEA